MREMWGRPSGCHIGSIFWRPTTMFPDHENPSNIAAAAATAPGNSEASTPEEAAPPVAEQAESTDGAPANLAPAPAMATEVSLSQKAEILRSPLPAREPDSRAKYLCRKRQRRQRMEPKRPA